MWTDPIFSPHSQERPLQDLLQGTESHQDNQDQVGMGKIQLKEDNRHVYMQVKTSLRKVQNGHDASKKDSLHC